MHVRAPYPKTDWSGRSRRDGGTAREVGGWRRRRRPAPSWASASWTAERPPAAAAAGSSPPLDQQRHANDQLRPDWNSEAQAAGLEKQELSRESREILSRGESWPRLSIPLSSLVLLLRLSANSYLLPMAAPSLDIQRRRAQQDKQGICSLA